MSEKKRRKGKKRPVADDSDSTVTDGRFAHIHHDPRFERLPSKKTKVAVDERFAGVFEEKRFAQPKVDKYGRKVKKAADSADSDLRRFYDDDDGNGSADDGSADDVQREQESAAVDASDSDSESGEATAPALDSDEQDSDAESTGAYDGDDAEAVDSGSESGSEGERPDWAEELDNDSEAEQVEMGDAHRRIAVLNCEWDRMNSTDILAVVKSFAPPGGAVQSVTVYPSEIGMKAMAEEEQHGPKLEGVVPRPVTGNDSDEADDYEEFDPEILRKYEQGKLKWYFAVVECDSIKTAETIYKECDGLEYERSGIILDLRYIPDDVAFPQAPRDTATEMAINYKAPLFTNKAKSSSKVEFTWDRDDPERFKMRKKKFTKDEINDIDLQAYLASESDDDDDDEKERQKQGRKKLRALLGEGGGAEKGENEDDDSEDEDDDNSESEQEDMVITFDGGLRNVGKDILEKKKQRELEAKETTWEAYLRKRQEKKSAKKAARKKSAQHNRNGGAAGKAEEEDLGFDDPFFQDEDSGKKKAGAGKQEEKEKDPFDDPFFDTADGDGDMNDAAGLSREDEGDSDGEVTASKKTNKIDSKDKKKKKDKKGKAQKKDDDDDDDPIAKALKARERAELELIVGADEDRDGERENSFNMKHLGTKKKKKKNRSKRKEREEDDDSDAPEDGDDGFRVDTGDDRFSAIFESQQFAIDPNDPKFKETPAMQKIMEERQERRRKKKSRQKGDATDSSSGPKKKKKKKNKDKQVVKTNDIAQLVASVKRKAA